MRAKRAAVVGLGAALLATACGAMLKDEESTWCRDHPEQIVVASYITGSPLVLADVLKQLDSGEPSPAYVRACRFAYENQ
jgi:hypothetical protein